LIKRSFQELSVAVETMRIIKELMEIWLNEVCDTHNTPRDNHPTEWPLPNSPPNNKLTSRALLKIPKNTLIVLEIVSTLSILFFLLDQE